MTTQTPLAPWTVDWATLPDAGDLQHELAVEARREGAWLRLVSGAARPERAIDGRSSRRRDLLEERAT